MEGTIAEIRMFAGTFNPRTWAFCQNQIISIASNTALFSLLGTTYGGNGQTTFALPDFRGRVPVGNGSGPGLSSYTLGQMGGTETNTINNSQFPAHTHPFSGSVTMPCTAADGTVDTAIGNYPAKLTGTDMYATTNNGSTMGNMQLALTAQPNGQPVPTPVNNFQPVMGMNYIICLQGIFPARN
ncbi:MAG: phage tail protein [Ferruginibacter sp.]|nr:phage tail protein [Ferruginibacter sp.]